MLKWLRSLGRVGEITAATITLFESKITWAFIVSAIVGALTWFWDGLFQILNNDHAQIAIVAFFITLWTYVAFRVLWIVRQTVSVDQVPDFRYCLSPESFQLSINSEDPDAALQLGFEFRNVSHWPIRLRVEQFRLIIEDRTCAEPEKKIEVRIPRIAVRGIRSGVFKKDVLKPRNIGTLDVTIVYGPADGDFLRRYRFRTKLHFVFPHNEQGKIVSAGVGEEFISEEDVPINTPE
jgi:hypothetical protein